MADGLWQMVYGRVVMADDLTIYDFFAGKAPKTLDKSLNLA